MCQMNPESCLAEPTTRYAVARIRYPASGMGGPGDPPPASRYQETRLRCAGNRIQDTGFSFSHTGKKICSSARTTGSCSYRSR